MIPAREALSALLLLALLALATCLTPECPGPGPLPLLAALATLHAALLSPLVAPGPPRWAFLAPLLALPALFATAYGHAGPWPLAGSLLLVTCGAASGAAARALPRRAGLYGATVTLLFAAPYALHYLALEMGDAATADGWQRLSPWAAARLVASGAPPPAPALLALLAWPVAALARGRR
jgi:hypothetical protein